MFSRFIYRREWSFYAFIVKRFRAFFHRFERGSGRRSVLSRRGR
ncbi:hypothetical protein ABLN67_03360 [Mycobacterium tuberculosis]